MTVAVVGDGAVGLSAVLAAKRLGAERIIALSRNPARQAVAREFGATDIVAERGEAAIEAVRSMTDGLGVEAALECVGTGESMATAFAIARSGGMVGAVGAPHDVEVPIDTVIFRNVGLRGGVSPARKYIPEMLDRRPRRADQPGPRLRLRDRPRPHRRRLRGDGRAAGDQEPRPRLGDGATSMSGWTDDELGRIARATELRLASRRSDGSLSRYATIWAVVAGDAVYVRSAHGYDNPWFQRALRSGTGRIEAGGVEREVAFEPAVDGVGAVVTAAYHAKYDRYGPAIVGTVVSPEAVRSTLRLVPRSRPSDDQPEDRKR